MKNVLSADSHNSSGPKHTKRGHIPAAITLAAVMCAVSPYSLAADPPATEDDSSIGLSQIVVTAQRYQERQQDVPIAISAFGAADLERMGVRQAGDIAATVPNLVLAQPYGAEAQPVFSLRGVTTNDFSQNQSAPVAMYVDEAYKPVGAVQALQTFDLDRVEVLRGPQGTLYGKNATGGAVNFYSKNPSLTGYDGYVEVGVGNYDERTVQGAVGGPISENTLGWRGAIYYIERNGWLDSINPGVSPLSSVAAIAGRLTFLAKATDALTVQLKVSSSHSSGTPYAVKPENNLPAVTGGNPQLGTWQNAALYTHGKTIDNTGASLNINWDIGAHAKLTSVTAYDFGRWYEVGDDASVGTQIWGPDTYASTVNASSEELRIASVDTDRMTWLAGAYFGQDKLHGWTQYHYFDAFPGAIFVPGSSAPLYGFDQANSYDQIRSSRAAFANLSVEVSPAVTLRGGLRYTNDRLAVKNLFALEGGLAGPPDCLCVNPPTLWTQTIPSIPGTYVDFSQGIYPRSAALPERSTSDSNVTYKAGADWKPASGILAYLSVSSGYRGAAFNSQAYNDPREVNFAKPEKLTSYEMGVKTEMFENRLQLNGDIYYYDYKNQQFLGTSTANGALLYKEVNAPKSTVKGAELELRAKVTRSLEVHGNLGMQDARYKEFVFDGVDVAGKQMAFAPKVTGSGGVDYSIYGLGSGTLLVSADASYSSKLYWDPENTERVAQRGWTIVNARL